jgi:hypothetical protein
LNEIETMFGMKSATEFAQRFLRLANLPNFALDRLSCYEMNLWRQTGKILHALDALDRRKPQERAGPFLIGGGRISKRTQEHPPGRGRIINAGSPSNE